MLGLLKLGIFLSMFSADSTDPASLPRFQAHTETNIIIGLDLDGLVLGLNYEPVGGGSYEFTLAEKSYFSRIIGIDNWFSQIPSVRLGRSYLDSHIQQLVFAVRLQPSVDFDFLGAPCKYGFGIGYKLAVLNQILQLADSSYINAVYQVKFYPAISLYINVYTDYYRESGVKFVAELDANSDYPQAGQFAILFIVRL